MTAAHERGSVVSADGTVIGFDVVGSGPPMVLVHGGTATRHRWAPVLPALAERYTLHVVDRRGRGLRTTEGGPYSIEREGADVAAVAEAAGAGAAVYVVAHSYGAICALEAALQTAAIGRLLLYEPPIPTPGHAVFPPGALDRLRSAAQGDDPERILRVFYREVLEVPDDAVEAMTSTEMWQHRLDAAPTIVREGDAVGSVDPNRYRGVRARVRLLTGTDSPHYYRPAAEAVVAAVPGADLRELSGQTHLAIDQDPGQFVRRVLEFAEAE